MFHFSPSAVLSIQRATRAVMWWISASIHRSLYRLSIQSLAKRALVRQRLCIIFGIGFYLPFEHIPEFIVINLALPCSSEMRSHS